MFFLFFSFFKIPQKCTIPKFNNKQSIVLFKLNFLNFPFCTSTIVAAYKRSLTSLSFFSYYTLIKSIKKATACQWKTDTGDSFHKHLKLCRLVWRRGPCSRSLIFELISFPTVSCCCKVSLSVLSVFVLLYDYTKEKSWSLTCAHQGWVN